MSEIKINNIPVITENNGSVELTTGTTNIGNNALVVNASGNVGVGTSSPGAKLHIVDDDNAGWLYYQYNIADGTNFRNYRARGTIDAPEAILANDRLASFLAGGYGVTNSSSGFSGPNGGISIHAAENFTNSSAGTYVVLQTSETGTNPAGGGVERMRITSSGYVTTPYQPSFNAYLSSGQAIAAGTWTKVNLNTTGWNVGSHFDISTHRFTAPVDGIYFLSYTVQFNTAVNGYLYTGLKVNGNNIPYGNGLRVDSFNTDNTLGHGTSYKLNTNDYVELWAYHGGGDTLGYGTVRTHMNGILLG